MDDHCNLASDLNRFYPNGTSFYGFYPNSDNPLCNFVSSCRILLVVINIPIIKLIRQVVCQFQCPATATNFYCQQVDILQQNCKKQKLSKYSQSFVCGTHPISKGALCHKVSVIEQQKARKTFLQTSTWLLSKTSI